VHRRLEPSLPKVQPYLKRCEVLCEEGGVAGDWRPVVLRICISSGEERSGEVRSGEVRPREVKSGEVRRDGGEEMSGKVRRSHRR
jgi:hypothetical protein